MLSSAKLNTLSCDKINQFFELGAEQHAVTDVDKLRRSAIRHSISLIFGPNAPQGDTALINAIKRWRDSERFATPDEAETVLNELFEKMLDQYVNERQAQLEQWHKQAQKLRIVPLYEKYDDLKLLAEHGDNSGCVVLCFEVNQGSAWRLVRAVDYRDSRPEILSLKEQLAALIYGNKLNPANKLLEKLSIRARVFRSEAQWRSFYPDGDTQLTLDDCALSRVYLGPELKSEVAEQITALSSDKLSHIKLYQLDFAEASYEIKARALKPDNDK